MTWEIWFYNFRILFKHNRADKCIYSKFTNDFGVIMSLYGWHDYY
jgi:hypothetical protein